MLQVQEYSNKAQ